MIEAKDGQLQQMRENEARREAEREIDRMWYHLMVREDQAKVSNQKLLVCLFYRHLNF